MRIWRGLPVFLALSAPIAAFPAGPSSRSLPSSQIQAVNKTIAGMPEAWRRQIASFLDSRDVDAPQLQRSLAELQRRMPWNFQAGAPAGVLADVGPARLLTGKDRALAAQRLGELSLILFPYVGGEAPLMEAAKQARGELAEQRRLKLDASLKRTASALGLSSRFDGVPESDPVIPVTSSRKPRASGLKPASKHREAASRVDELLAAENAASELFDQSYYSEAYPGFKEALETLIQAGITPGMRVGSAYDATLTGDRARAQKLEWYLGQVLEIAQGAAAHKRPNKHFFTILEMGRDLARQQGGADVSGDLFAIEKRNAEEQRSFKRVFKRRGFIRRGDDDGYQFSALFGSDSSFLSKLEGRTVAALVQGRGYGLKEGYDLRQVSGRLTKDPREGAALFVVDTGQERVALNFNDVLEFFVEDTSPITKVQFHENAKRRDFLSPSSPNAPDLIGSWFDAFALSGRRASFLMADQENGRWKVLEGIIRPDPAAGGNAPFFLEIEGEALPMNINKPKAYYVEDISPITPRQYAKNAKARGFISMRSDEYIERFGSWFDARKVQGRRASVLRVDAEARRYEVLEGVIQFDPEAMGAAPFFLDTASGREALNINYIKEMWVENGAAGASR